MIIPKSINSIFFSLFLAAFAGPTFAQYLDTSVVNKAQSAMIGRVRDAVETYAAKIKAEKSLVTYCRQELSLKTSLYPVNGQIPFGINYNQIRDTETLETIIWNRESYETWFLKLCLANCRIPDDCINSNRYPLFMARAVLRELIESL